MNDIAFLTAFVVANYYVGKKLDALQFWIMTGIYSVLALSTAGNVAIQIQNILVIDTALDELGRTLQLVTFPVADAARSTWILMASLYLSSIYFAIHSRWRA